VTLYKIAETLCDLLRAKNKLIIVVITLSASCLALHTNRPLHALIVTMGVGLVKGAGV